MTPEPGCPESQTSAFVTTLNREHKGFKPGWPLIQHSPRWLEIAILGAIQSLTTSGLVCI